MFVEERHQEILRLLNENEKVKVKELSKRFEVTEDCIRKDLASMEARNLLKRTYGGAVLPDTLHPGHTNIVSTRKDKNIKEKRKEKYRYLIYGNEMDEEYVKYEFDLITLDNKKDFIDNYLGGKRCTLKMKH